MAFVFEQVPLEKLDEDKTSLRKCLFLDAASYHHAPIFDLPPAQGNRLEENFLISPNGSFGYQNPLLHQGLSKGVVIFNGEKIIPMLIDMQVRCHTGERFLPGTDRGNRVKWGAVWMSLTPSEMLTQRPGVEKAHGTVVIGGLGLGWFLRKVCEKESVEKVFVVEKSQELLDWYGYDLCQRYPKVNDVICDDVFHQLGKHGGKAVYLLDIWRLYSGASRDQRVRAWKRKLKKRLWAWGKA